MRDTGYDICNVIKVHHEGHLLEIHMRRVMLISQYASPLVAPGNINHGEQSTYVCHISIQLGRRMLRKGVDNVKWVIAALRKHYGIAAGWLVMVGDVASGRIRLAHLQRVTTWRMGWNALRGAHRHITRPRVIRSRKVVHESMLSTSIARVLTGLGRPEAMDAHTGRVQ